jgi:hypothetical protein
MTCAGEKGKIYVLAAAAGACASQPASLAGAAHSRSLASALKMHCNCKIIGGGLSLWVLGGHWAHLSSLLCPVLSLLAP